MPVILIADDSGTARMILHRCVEMICRAPTTILEAPDGQVALEMARSGRIDLLLTDLNMPAMDGKELLLNIKASPRLNHIPVVVISSSANTALDRELRGVGADLVIHKPVSPEIMQRTFQELAARDLFHDA